MAWGPEPWIWVSCSRESQQESEERSVKWRDEEGAWETPHSKV